MGLPPSSSQPTPSALNRRRFLSTSTLAAAAAATAATAVLAAPAARAASALRPPRRKAKIPRPPTPHLALSKMAFGPSPADLQWFASLGSSDNKRFKAYVDIQLNPSAIDDSACDARIAAAGIDTLNVPLAQAWQERVVADVDFNVRQKPFYDVERAAFIRATYSKRQLAEVMADFWHDHFNIYGPDFYSGPVWADFDTNVIRKHMFGNFRQFLQAVGTHPAMLIYLDNFTNTRSGPNENYARELFELHGMGAENYLGVRPQTKVRKVNGVPVGYVDGDVYEAARAFTGWSLNFDTGAFTYTEDDHDRFQKLILGRQFPPDQGQQEDGNQVYDLIANHPGTAKYVARRLCKRLVGDNPPGSVVKLAANVFRANRGAPDQLKKVVRAILVSKAFRRTWGRKVKRPFEYVVSALRGTGAEYPFGYRTNPDEANAGDYFLWSYEATGHALFRWPTPDGYPDFSRAWLASSPMIRCWRFMLWLVEQNNNGDYYCKIIEGTPTSSRTPAAVATFWLNRLFGFEPSPELVEQATSFLSQGRDPNLPLDFNDGDVRDQVRAMVAMLLCSPAFRYR